MTPKTGPKGRSAPSPVRMSSAIRRNRSAMRGFPLRSVRIAVRNRNRILSSTFIIIVIPVFLGPTPLTPTPPHAFTYVQPHHPVSPAHTHQTQQARVSLHQSRRSHPFHPGPRTARPGIAPVCSPSETTATPFTNTCSIPVDSWWGSSYVAWSATVSGSKITRSA